MVLWFPCLQWRGPAASCFISPAGTVGLPCFSMVLHRFACAFRQSLLCVLLIGWFLSSLIVAVCDPYPRGGILVVAFAIYLLLQLLGAQFLCCVAFLHGLHGVFLCSTACLFFNSACEFWAPVTPDLCPIYPFVLQL